MDVVSNEYLMLIHTAENQIRIEREISEIISNAIGLLLC